MTYLSFLKLKTMKKKLFYLIILILTTASCGSVVRVNREQVSSPIIYATRDDISITDDLTATGKVKTVSVLFVNFYKWNEDKRQLKIGPFRFLDRNYEEGVFNGASSLSKEFDEKIALYNFINQYNDLDYVTNVRYKKSFERKPFYWKALNIGARTSETTIIAKGVILKNKVPKQN